MMFGVRDNKAWSDLDTSWADVGFNFHLSFIFRLTLKPVTWSNFINNLSVLSEKKCFIMFIKICNVSFKGFKPPISYVYFTFQIKLFCKLLKLSWSAGEFKLSWFSSSAGFLGIVLSFLNSGCIFINFLSNFCTWLLVVQA